MPDQSLPMPRRRPTIVDMAQYVRDNAAAMDAAVLAWEASTPRERRRTVARIRKEFADLRPLFGLAPIPTNLHSSHVPEGRVTQAKIAKNELPTLALTLQSATLCRVTLPDGTRLILSTCPNMGLCGRVCVLGHGRGKWADVRAGRDWRTYCLYVDPCGFAILMRDEIRKACEKHGGDVLDRPNVNADLPFHLIPALWAPTEHGRILAYGYSKDPAVLDTCDGWMLPTYRVTYSLNEKSDDAAVARFVRRGGTAAIVTNRHKSASVRDRIRIGGRSLPVVDGDKSDDRYHDPAGVLVDLYAKGRAIGMVGGLVRSVY